MTTACRRPGGGWHRIASATDWLVGSGVALDNGVVCDEVGRASEDEPWVTSRPGGMPSDTDPGRTLEQRRRPGPVMVPAMLGQEPRGGGGAPFLE